MAIYPSQFMAAGSPNANEAEQAHAERSGPRRRSDTRGGAGAVRPRRLIRGVGVFNPMAKIHNAKVKELQRAMRALGERLDKGDESSLFVEVIPGRLMCSYRPLRRHHNPDFRGPQRDLPAEAAPALLDWTQKMRTAGIQAIICLMGPAELVHYKAVVSVLGATDLVGLYVGHGFEVCTIPWEDPLYRVGQGGRSYEDQLLEVREQCLRAFDALPKPVLLHCSSGIQRSSQVAAFIYSQRCDDDA